MFYSSLLFYCLYCYYTSLSDLASPLYNVCLIFFLIVLYFVARDSARVLQTWQLKLLSALLVSEVAVVQVVAIVAIIVRRMGYKYI